MRRIISPKSKGILKIKTTCTNLVQILVSLAQFFPSIIIIFFHETARVHTSIMYTDEDGC